MAEGYARAAYVEFCCCLLFVVCCLLFVVCCLLFAVCCLLLLDALVNDILLVGSLEFSLLRQDLEPQMQ